MSREVLPAGTGLHVRQRLHADADGLRATDPPVSRHVPSRTAPAPTDPTEPTGLTEPTEPTGPMEPTGDAASADPVLRLDEAPAGEAPPAAGPGASGRRPGPLLVAVVAIACLAAGALAGSGAVRPSARHQLDVTDRVLMWTDGAQVPAGTGAGSHARIRVWFLATGRPTVLERVLFGPGTGDTDGVTLQPGDRTAADLRLVSDCDVLTQDSTGITTDLSRIRAVVRPVGERQSRQVPVELVADPSPLWLSLLSPCSAATRQVAEEGLSAPDPSTFPGASYGSPALTASTLAVTSSGRLTFALRSRGSVPVRFTLPVAAVAGSRARFTLRAHPSLPVTVRPGTAVRVVVDVSASCRTRSGSLPSTYGLLLPQVATAPTTVHSAPGGGVVPLEGWDDGLAAEALTAAALRSCR